MDKYVFIKYNYLVSNNYIYKKLLTIKNLNEKELYINSIYYPITDTIFLTKYMHYDLGNYINIFKIKIFFNIFTLTADIQIYKIKKQEYLETETIIDKFNNIKFNEKFILNHIIYHFNDVHHLEMLPILLKCRSRLNEEYMNFLVLFYSIFLKGSFYIPRHIIKNIIGFLLYK